LFIEIAFDVADRILRGRAKIAERAYALGLGLVTAFNSPLTKSGFIDSV